MAAAQPTSPLARTLAATRRTILLIALFLAASGGTARGLDTLYLVRHAEKQEGWPADRDLAAMQPLSAEGLLTAKRIAARLHAAPIVAVYTSPTTRTAHTGLFTALDHQCHLLPDARTIEQGSLEEWIADLQVEHPGPGAVLVVGHSNTIPWFFAALGADPSCHDALGVSEQAYGLAAEGHESYWQIDLSARGCAAIVRRSITP